MSTTYQKFCDRLKDERIRIKLSQLEISHFLRMNQSHYSKAELGKRRFSYYELQYLCETQVDVYYAFTGFRYEIKETEFLLESTVEELKCYLEILCVLYMCMYRKNMLFLSNSMYKRIEHIRYALMQSKRGKTIFYNLRRALNYSQNKMAELLGVDIKKLRNLESGKILPDCEIICRFSNNFYIPYALLLQDKKGLVCEINYLLELVEENRRKDILESILSIQKNVLLE